MPGAGPTRGTKCPRYWFQETSEKEVRDEKGPKLDVSKFKDTKKNSDG